MTLHPALLVHPAVHPSITLLFLGFCGPWPHCSCPNDQMTSNTAPAHPHATGVAMYPALFFWTLMLLTKWSSDLKYGPCPPIRDLCSRVSGLVKLWRFSISDWRSEIALLCPSIRQSFSPSVRLSVHWLVGHTLLFL